MADLSITVANIQLAGAGVQTTEAICSEAITQGMVVRRDSSNNNKYSKSINTGEATAAASGIALTKTLADGQYMLVATTGPINIGATLVVGETYYLSGTAGGIMPSSDLATDDWVTRIGVAITASILNLDIDVSGVQRA